MLFKTKTKNVLVVDDNANMAKCLADMVEIYGLPCVTANDGDEAIKLIKSEKFSLIIADTNMPKISGFSLLKYVKKNFPKIPVALISTRNSEMTQDVVVKYKPDYYLAKPFKTSDIENLLSQI